jgi:hypothetical protein
VLFRSAAIVGTVICLIGLAVSFFLPEPAGLDD